MVFPTMFFTTLARTLILTLAFVYLEEYACILVLFVGILPLISSIKYFRTFKEKVLLGAIITLFAPCYILHDFSHYYQVVSITSSIAYMLSFGYLTSSVVMDIPQKCSETNASLWLVNMTLRNDTIQDLFKKLPRIHISCLFVQKSRNNK